MDPGNFYYEILLLQKKLFRKNFGRWIFFFANSHSARKKTKWKKKFQWKKLVDVILPTEYESVSFLRIR